MIRTNRTFIVGNDPTNGGRNVIGLGIERFGGHYYAQYQLGDPSTYRPVALFDLGTTCPVVS